MNRSRQASEAPRVQPRQIPGVAVRDRRELGTGTNPTISAILELQRTVGNRAVTGLLESPRVSAPLHVQRDLGWKDASKAGKGWNVGQQEVGQIHRIPLQDLKQGLQQESAKRRWIPKKGKVKGHWEEESTMLPGLSSESAKGKAIAVVPAALAPTQPIEVLIMLHGYTETTDRPFAGWRELNPKAGGNATVKALRQGLDKDDVAPVRDVALDQAEQQLDETGYTQTMIVLPQGGLHSQFGLSGDTNFDSDAYSKEIVRRLFDEGVWKGAATAPQIGRVSMAGHSGAGATLANMARESVNRQAGKEPGASSPLSGDLVLFDAINSKGELDAFKAWALMRLDQDLAELQRRKTDALKLEYLKTAPKLRGYYSVKIDYGYGKRYRSLDDVIGDWFSVHRAALGPMAAPLRANFTVVPIPVVHEELMRGVGAGEKREGSGDILDALRALHGDKRALDPNVAKAVSMAKTGGTVSGRAAVAKIVKKATGTDVKTWFADLAPEATFLGRPIRPSSPGEPPGVHRELAVRLTAGENSLIKAGEKPGDAGARLGVRDIAGVRVPKAATGKKSGASMHCFGLAVDIDHDDNPFVGNDDTPAKAGPGGGPSLQIIQHATLLLAGSPHDAMREPPPLKGNAKTDLQADRATRAARAVEQWRLLHTDSELVQKYLSLTTEQLDAALVQRLPTLKAWKEAQTAPPPVAKGKKKTKKVDSPPAWAEHVTESDWWHTTLKADKKQSRTGDFGYGANPAKSGFMTLHEEVVQALVAAGLSWGGTYNAEKDIMHFDFRSGSIGQAAGAHVV
jgi:hypothetical protein